MSQHPPPGPGYQPPPVPPAAPYPPYAGAFTGPAVPTPTPTPGRGLAVTAVVLSALALVGVLVLTGIVLSGGDGAGSGPDVPLTGRLSTAPSGGQAAGTDLAAEVRSRISDDGGDVSAMTCPDTPKVAQGVVTVCHGTISGDEWAVVVFFEDENGTFLLDPL